MLDRHDNHSIHRAVKSGLVAGALVFFSTASFATGVPVPSLPSLPVVGGGGGPGGGPGGGGPGGGPTGPGSGSVAGSGGVNLSGPGMTFQGVDDGSDVSGSSGPNSKWGDPLSTDLRGNGKVHARLRYYGESSALGTTQGVGINLSWPQ